MVNLGRLVLVVMVTLGVSVPAIAQQPKFRVVKPLPASKTKTAMRPILKGEAGYDKKVADDYYRKTLLAELTLPPRNGAKVRDGRAYGSVKTNVMRDLAALAAKNPASHSALVKDLLTWCAAFANPKYNFSPAVQYNAQLIIASLNDKEATNSSLPVPSTKAYGSLYKGLSSTSDPVVVASLIGIHRHAELHRLGSKMSAKAKNLFSAAVYKLLKSECPSSRSLSGHEWMQRRAMQILAAFGDPGKGNAVAKALDEIILNEKASLAMRCSAIDALSRLKMTSADGLDVGKTTVGVATTTAMVCREVSTRLAVRWNERENNGGSFGGGYGGAAGGYGGYGGGAGGGEGYGGYGGAGGRSSGGDGYGGAGGYGGYGRGGAEEEEEEKEPEDPLLTEARRDLKHQLGCLRDGVKQLLKLSPESRKLSGLDKEIDAILAEADAEELKVGAFQQQVAKTADRIESDFDIKKEVKPKPAARRGGFRRGGGGRSMDG